MEPPAPSRGTRKTAALATGTLTGPHTAGEPDVEPGGGQTDDQGRGKGGGHSRRSSAHGAKAEAGSGGRSFFSRGPNHKPAKGTSDASSGDRRGKLILVGGLVVMVVALGMRMLPSGSEEPAPSEEPTPAVSSSPGFARAASIEDLDEGDCFDLPDGDVASDVEQVDCSGPHDAELLGRAKHPAAPGVDYPGEVAMQKAARDGCLEVFETAVGTPWVESSLDFAFVAPNDTYFERDNGRSIECALTAGPDLRFESGRRVAEVE